MFWKQQQHKNRTQINTILPEQNFYVLIYYLCTSHCLWGFCVGLCFGMHYSNSFLVLQSPWRGRESWLLCFNCRPDVLLYCICSVALPHSAVGWSAVCNCGISWSYSLTYRLNLVQLIKENEILQWPPCFTTFWPLKVGTQHERKIPLKKKIPECKVLFSKPHQ